MDNGVLRVIEEFNNKHNIKNVIEIITGQTIKGKSLCCPLHDGDNKNGASIHQGKNIFTCWTSDCGKGLTPWQFISKYYNLNGFKEVAEKINILFNTNIPIYEKKVIQAPKRHIESDIVLKVENYLSECKNNLGAEITHHKHILLNANTGLGKTYGIIDLFKDNKEMDYIFFLVPTRSIAEQVAKDYPIFNLFYGNDVTLPDSKFIVSTYHKIHMLERALEGERHTRAVIGEFPEPFYTVIVDEIHELQAKRKLLGSKAHMIEQFIKNSDNSVLMSANTNYINKTYKNKGLFDRYIIVDTESIKYNADNFNILRLPKGNDQKKVLTINLIKDKLKAYNNVIFYEDSIEQLKEYERELKALGLECIVINSQNKGEDEEVAEEYKSIIEDSKLNKTIILTTSLINAGVNIKSNKVALVVKQDRNKFDIQKVEQFLARVRSKDNDLTLLLGSTDKEVNKNVIPYDMFLRKLERESENIRLFFNDFIFNEYGLNITHNKVKNKWDMYKSNEVYNQVKDIMYVENGLLKVDEPMIYEMARIEYERANYYNNEFILDQLANIKAKNRNISTLAPATVEKKKVLKEENTFKEDLEIILKDSGSLAEFLKLVAKKIKGTELKQELLKEFYNKYNQRNKLYKEMMSSLRNAILPVIDNENISKISMLINIMTEYTKDTSKKERTISIQNIKRVEIYNKENPLGATYESIQAIGDLPYLVVRKNFDCFVTSNNSIFKSAYKWAFNDLIELRKLEPLNNKYCIDNNKKKYKINDIVIEIESCVNSIYNITDKKYILELK